MSYIPKNTPLPDIKMWERVMAFGETYIDNKYALKIYFPAAARLAIVKVYKKAYSHKSTRPYDVWYRKAYKQVLKKLHSIEKEADFEQSNPIYDQTGWDEDDDGQVVGQMKKSL